MSQAIAELSHTRGDVEVQWTIRDFFSLPEKEDSFHESDLFCFAGASFCLKVYPNGETRHNSGGKMSLYLMRWDCGSPVKLQYTLGLMTADGKRTNTYEYEDDFERKGCGYGHTGIISRSELLDRKAELAPSDALTVFCSLTCNTSCSLQGSIINRLADVSASLKNILTEKKQTDVVLEVEGREFSAHQAILESRSPVFKAMFDHDMKENRTGKVVIKDIPAAVFEPFLSYVYCGDVEGLSQDNVYDVYGAAEKYDFKGLKLKCRAFIERNLSAERVCDVIKFAQLYGETQTERIAKEYFRENIKTVMKTDQWKTLAKEDPTFSLELVTSAIEEVL